MSFKKLNNSLNGNVNLGKLNQAQPGESDYAERNRSAYVRVVGGDIPNRNSYIIGYNRPKWLHKFYALWHSNYDNVNKPYNASLDSISRAYPKTTAPMGSASWVDSINQVHIPRNMFQWHPVPELANIPISGGSPDQVSQQYIMVQPSEQLVANLLTVRRMVPRTQTPTAYGQPLVTISDTGIVISQRLRDTPGLYQNVVNQARSGNNFFTWLVQAINGGGKPNTPKGTWYG